jgi:hypothetical protein
MMAENLPAWLSFFPHPHGDPGPEVYRYLAELPAERQGPIIEAINAARGELESVRAKGYAQIGTAIAAAGHGSAAKR